jgi:hypothetical protein
MSKYFIYNTISGEVITPQDLADDLNERGKTFRWNDLFDDTLTDLKILTKDELSKMQLR